MSDKSAKFVEFYLTELLNHVRRMSEQRFAPAEYHRVKRLVAFILSEPGAVANIARLENLQTLKSLHAVLAEIVNRVTRPDFRKGEMLANIELESEKLSQALHQMSRQPATTLASDFRQLGIAIDAPVPTDVHPSPVEKISVQPVVQKAAQPFTRVDDLVGFFKRREKSDGIADIAKADARIEKLSANVSHPGVLDETIRRVNTALEKLASQPKRTRFLLELGYAYNELARVCQQFGMDAVSGRAGLVKASIDRKVDLIEDEKAELTDDAIGLLRTLVANTSEALSGKAGATEAMDNAIRAFDKLGEPGSDDEAFIQLILEGIDDGDLKIFREDSRFHLERMQEAVGRLRSDVDLAVPLEDVYRSLRSLNTASRLLRFDPLVSALHLVGGAVQRVQRSETQFVPSWASDLLSFSNDCIQLIEGGRLAESHWVKLIERLADPIHPAAGAAEETRSMPIVSPEVASEIATRIAEPEVVPTPASKINWTDELQATIDQHPFQLQREVVDSPAPLTVDAQKSAAKAAVEEAPGSEIVAAIQETAEVVRKPARHEAPVTDSRTARVESDLLRLMAAGDTDLTDYRIRQFTEKLEIEPENIGSGGAKAKKVRKVAKPVKPTAAEVAVIPAASGGFVLAETNFESIDAEILDIFVQESDGYFKILDKAIERLKSNLKDDASMKEIERSSHSLKSSSRMLGLARISSLAAAIELIAERCNEKELEFVEDLRLLISHAVEITRQLVDRKPVEAKDLVVNLALLERKLSAPNIFIGNIPGASSFAETLPDAGAPIKLRAVTAEDKKPESVSKEAEKPVDATKPVGTAESGHNYFEQIGVDEDIVEIFKEEAGSYLKLMMSALSRLNDDLTHKGAIKDIEKSAHSLRSSTKMLGFQKISNLIRPIEAIAERIGKHSLVMNSGILDLLTRSADTIQHLVEGTDADTQALVDALIKVEESEASQATVDTTQVPVTSPVDRPKTRTMGRKVRKSKNQEAYFADIQFTADPILRNLDKGSVGLLEEMHQSSM